MSQQNAKSKLLPGHRWLEQGEVIREGDMLYCEDGDGDVGGAGDLGRKVGTSNFGPQWDHHRYSRAIEPPAGKSALDHLREAMHEARRAWNSWERWAREDKKSLTPSTGFQERCLARAHAAHSIYLDLRRRVRECEKGGEK